MDSNTQTASEPSTEKFNKHTYTRVNGLQRKLIGWTSTRADRKRKKVERTRRRLGRLHNGKTN